MAGRKPKPSHLKLLAGNPGKRKINDREPRPRRTIPRAPTKMSRDERAAWNSFAPVLDRMGVLTEADKARLVLLCEAFADYRRARAVIDSAGPTYSTLTPTGDTMYRPRPEYAQMIDAWKRVAISLSEFGLTPAARSKIRTNLPDADDAWFGENASAR